ncbi:hypothetical protein ONZ45_g1283 [Pleurotus djamor]|nr:hypothetical protein ONZ45_g1283 [Pleurotus djamor]
MSSTSSERFKELSLTYSTLFSVDAGSSVATSISTPLLHTLTLKAARNRCCYVQSPPPFIGPSLTILRLKDVTFEPNIPTLPSLRTLIVGADFFRDGNLNVIWMSKILRNTPNIEEAHIWGVCFPNGPDIPPITLPRIKQISIASDTGAIWNLFDLLRYPKPMAISILALLPGPFGLTDLSRRLETSTPFFPFMTGLEFTNLDKMRIVRVDDGEPTQTSIHIELFSPYSPEPTMALSVPFDSDRPRLYLEICTRFSLYGITELVLSHFQPSQVWQALFSALTNLETLSLEDLGDSWIPHLLVGPTTTPSLKVISYNFVTLQGTPSANLENIRNMCSTTTQAPDAVMDVSPLQPDGGFSRIQFIERRRDAGVPLQKLIIRECNISRRYIDLLRTCITVEWDGIEQVIDIGSKCPGPYSKKYLNMYSNNLTDFDEGGAA